MVTDSRSRLSAPIEDSDASSDECTPSFCMTVPSSGDESSDDGEVTSSRLSSHSRAGVSMTQQAASYLSTSSALRHRDGQVSLQRRLSRLEVSFHELDVQEQRRIAAIQEQFNRTQTALASEDAAQQRQREEGRQELLQGLKATHAAKAQEGDRQIRQREQHLALKQREAEEKLRRDKQAAEAAAAARNRAEQEAAAAAQAEAARQSAEEESKRQQREKEEPQRAAAVAQQQQQQQAAAPGAGPATGIAPSTAAQEGVPPGTTVWATRGAVDAEQAVLRTLRETQEAAQQAQRDPGADKAKLRNLKKHSTLYVQQISASQEQVTGRTQAILEMLAQCSTGERTYGVTLLADRLVAQCEAQVMLKNSFAFPLAMVAVAIACYHPSFADVLIAKLQQKCIVLVPKYYSSPKQDVEYLKRLGYQERDGPPPKGAPPDAPNVEPTDDYMARMAAYVLFYAAFVQVDHPQHPHGINHGWSYLARLFNALPVNRLAAVAVDAFLRVAGYRLHLQYRRQFVKLLQYVMQEFLPALPVDRDPDVRAVRTRIASYIQQQEFLREPEGRSICVQDYSSYDRA